MRGRGVPPVRAAARSEGDPVPPPQCGGGGFSAAGAPDVVPRVPSEWWATHGSSRCRGPRSSVGRAGERRWHRKALVVPVAGAGRGTVTACGIGVRLGQPSSSLSLCLAFIFPHAAGTFQADGQARVSRCVPDYRGLFLGKRGRRAARAGPPCRPCLGCFTLVPGQGTGVAVPSLRFQLACSCRSARSSFHSRLRVSGQNDKLQPRRPVCWSPLLAVSRVCFCLNRFHFPFQAFWFGTGSCAGSEAGSLFQRNLK